MEPTEEQIKRFIMLGYATDAFKFGRFDCEQLAKIENMENMTWFCGITSLVSHYSRPFKRSKNFSSLEVDYVPEKYRSIHAKLVEARDKAHVHLDGDFLATETSQGAHQVRLLKERDGKHHWIPLRVLLIGKGDIPVIISFLDHLLARLDEETDAIENNLLPFIGKLNSGLYLLSTTTPFFKRDRRYDGIDSLDDIVTIN
jgi:hypothetical protein